MLREQTRIPVIGSYLHHDTSRSPHELRLTMAASMTSHQPTEVGVGIPYPLTTISPNGTEKITNNSPKQEMIMPDYDDTASETTSLASSLFNYTWEWKALSSNPRWELRISGNPTESCWIQKIHVRFHINVTSER